MTTIFTETFEEGIDGHAITAANSSFGHLVSGTWIYTAEDAISGPLSGKATASSGTAIANGLSAWTAAATVYARIYAKFTTMPTATTAVAQFRSGTTLLAEVRITTTGQVQLRNSASSQVYVSAAGVVTAGTWVRLGWMYNNSTGQQQVRIYTGANVNGATADVDSSTVITIASGTCDGYQLGLINATTATVLFDSVAISNSGFLGPIGGGTNTPPTCSAGADQDNVEPWATVTVTGTDADSDGTIATRLWSQSAGTPITGLTGAATATATFTAPPTLAGDTVTMQYTVTDNGGASATDTVNIGVLPATERAVIGGVEVPMQVRSA